MHLASLYLHPFAISSQKFEGYLVSSNNMFPMCMIYFLFPNDALELAASLGIDLVLECYVISFGILPHGCYLFSVLEFNGIFSPPPLRVREETAH